MTPPRTIDCPTLNHMRIQSEPHILLDVREHWEYEIAHLEPSLHVPLASLTDAIANLPQDIPIIIICHHGVRSLKACLLLRNEGYKNAVSLAGGIDAWSLLVDPSIARY